MTSEQPTKHPAAGAQVIAFPGRSTSVPANPVPAVAPAIGTVLRHEGISYPVIGWMTALARSAGSRDDPENRDTAGYQYLPVVHGERLVWCARAQAGFVVCRRGQTTVILPVAATWDELGTVCWSPELIAAAERFAQCREGLAWGGWLE